MENVFLSFFSPLLMSSQSKLRKGIKKEKKKKRKTKMVRSYRKKNVLFSLAFLSPFFFFPIFCHMLFYITFAMWLN